MKINRPELNECKLLFDSDSEALTAFLEKYKKEIEACNLERDLDLDIIFSYIFGVTIDWREYDSDIIKYFGEYIPEKNVAVEETKTGLKVLYDKSSFDIKLSFSGADRYITIRAFNKIISKDYEIRLFDSSFYSDTHVFLILPKPWWDELDSRYGEKTGEIFTVITETLDFP
jgi:hypothetical protein